MQQIVRVKNVGTERFSDMSNSQPTMIDPGGETLVPMEAVTLWLGDPDSRDFDARRTFRTDEFERLLTRYGVYQNEHMWEQVRPKLEVYTLDGVRIATVAEDPRGEGLDIVVSNDSTTETLLRTQLDSMKTQMDAITSALSSDGAAKQLVSDMFAGDDQVAVDPAAPVDASVLAADIPEDDFPDSDEPPADSPTKVKVGSPRGRKTSA